MAELMLGNKAFARGLYEGGCSVVSSYPGTPSTEVTEEEYSALIVPEIVMKFTVSGHRMRRWRSRWRSGRASPEKEVFAV